MKEDHNVHVPPPSFWPIALASGLALIAIGVISGYVISIAGVIVLLVSLGGWAMENRAEEAEEEANHE